METLKLPAGPIAAAAVFEQLLSGRFSFSITKVRAASADVSIPVVWGDRETIHGLRINRTDLSRLLAAKGN